MRKQWKSLVACLTVLTCCAFSQAVQSDDSESNSLDAARTRDITQQRADLFALAATKGGFQAWYTGLEPFREDLRARFATVTDSQLYFGEDNRVFFAGHMLDYLYGSWTKFQWDNAEEFSAHPGPVVADFSNQLRARGIDFIFMPIPKVEEIYPETLSPLAPPDHKVSPARTEFLLSLIASGTEVIDLLPVYLQAREESNDNLYFYRDNHWSSHGIRLAAKIVSERLARYPFAQGGTEEEPKYKTQWVDYQRMGVTLMFMTDEEREGLKPLPYKLSTVVDHNGQPFRETPGAPILILGDSNVGSMRSTNEQLDRLSAHIALETNLPVETLWMVSGFSRVNIDLARKGSKFLEGRRVVIWTGDSMALSNSDWHPVELPR